MFRFSVYLTPRLEFDCRTWWGAVVGGKTVIGADRLDACELRLRGCSACYLIRSNTANDGVADTVRCYLHVCYYIDVPEKKTKF